MMDFSALGITKMAATFIVGAGTKTIVNGIINNNIETPETTFGKVKIVAATTILSAVVAKAAKNHTNEMIDDIASYVSKTFKAMQDGDSILDDLLHKDAATVVDDEPAVKVDPIVTDKTPANGTSN
jgi:hypothetical protein